MRPLRRGQINVLSSEPLPARLILPGERHAWRVPWWLRRRNDGADCSAERAESLPACYCNVVRETPGILKASAMKRSRAVAVENPKRATAGR